MRPALKLVALFLLLISLRFTSQAQSSTPYMTINTDVVKKSIVFLFYSKGADKTEVATGFLLRALVKNDPVHQHSMIVTARHVVDPEWAGCSWGNPAALTVRVNTKDYQPGVSSGGVWQTSFPLAINGQKMWLTHSDDRVDVAIIPIVTDQEAELLRQDDAFLEVADFGTPEEIQKYQIGIGANIISAGLVPGLWNEKRNYPAFKFGKVSNVLDEPIKMHCEAGVPKKTDLAG